MGIFELILYPFYVAFFYFVFKSFRKKYTDPVLQYYHAQGFWIKTLIVLVFAFFNWKISTGDSFVLYQVEGKNIYDLILKDLSNYAYPILSVQAEKPIGDFFNYYISLIKLGFGRQPLFHAYFFSILLLGTRRMDNIIAWIKSMFGYTPAIGSVYAGDGKRQ